VPQRCPFDSARNARNAVGWSSVAMRRTYSHASPEVVRDALSRSAAQLQLEP